MAPEVVAILVESAKFGIQSYFSYMRLAGKTEEEMDALYQEERTKMLKSDPNNLPDVE